MGHLYSYYNLMHSIGSGFHQRNATGVDKCMRIFWNRTNDYLYIQLLQWDRSFSDRATPAVKSVRMEVPIAAGKFLVLFVESPLLFSTVAFKCNQ